MEFAGHEASKYISYIFMLWQNGLWRRWGGGSGMWIMLVSGLVSGCWNTWTPTGRSHVCVSFASQQLCIGTVSFNHRINITAGSHACALASLAASHRSDAARAVIAHVSFDWLHSQVTGFDPGNRWSGAYPAVLLVDCSRAAQVESVLMNSKQGEEF
jgi:hypothetical protein